MSQSNYTNILSLSGKPLAAIAALRLLLPC
jgi:hypothetical protein